MTWLCLVSWLQHRNYCTLLTLFWVGSYRTCSCLNEGEKEVNQHFPSTSCVSSSLRNALYTFITTTQRGKFNFTKKETEVPSLTKVNLLRSPTSKGQGAWYFSCAHPTSHIILPLRKAWGEPIYSWVSSAHPVAIWIVSSRPGARSAEAIERSVFKTRFYAWMWSYRQSSSGRWIKACQLKPASWMLQEEWRGTRAGLVILRPTNSIRICILLPRSSK